MKQLCRDHSNQNSERDVVFFLLVIILSSVFTTVSILLAVIDLDHALLHRITQLSPRGVQNRLGSVGVESGDQLGHFHPLAIGELDSVVETCLLYTSDAADE